MKKLSTGLLTELSKEICGMQDKVELVKVITQKLKVFLDFAHISILIINKSENYYYDFTIQNAGIDNSVAKKILTQQGIDRMTYSNSCVEMDIELIERSGKPILVDLKEHFLRNPDHPILKVGVPSGYQHSMATILKAGGSVFGIWYINAEKDLPENPYRETDFEVFEAFASFVAIAINNILSQENIHKQEEDQKILLQISEQLSAVRNKEQLYQILQKYSKQHFRFYDSGILLLNGKESYFDYSQNESNLSLSPVNIFVHANHFYKSGSIPLKDSVLEKVLKELEASNSPLVFDYSADYSSFHDAELIDALYQKGYREAIIGLLKSGGTNIGVYILNYTDNLTASQQNLRLFESIANQISIAVRNILAQEEIYKQEEEKSILLSISNEIARIRDLETLISWLQDKAKNLLGADYAMITLSSREKNKAFYVLGNTTAEWQIQGSGVFRKGIIDSGIPFHGSFYEYIESLPDGFLYKIEELPDTIHSIPVEFCKSLEIRESFPMNLIHKAEIIGHICIHSKTEGTFTSLNIPLLRNMVNQITIALINILSTEEMNEREKQKNLEISVNNAVLANESFGDVLGEISASINNAVGCDICYIRVLTDSFDPSPFHFFCEKFGNKFSVRAVDAKVVDTGITPSQAGKNAEEFLTTMNSPTILSGLRLEELTPKYKYLQIFTQKIGIKSFIFLPLKLKYNCVAYLILGSRTAYAYIENDLDLIVSIKTQLSLTLDNRLAFHQINHLKELLETENLYLQEELHDSYNFNEIIGSSEALRNVFNQASMVAGTDSTVLLIGETGTGKELVARAIHNLSNRKDRVMVKVNCACLPVQLIESELFGHERGAFTGAIERRIGKFELANGGTIFLDEIGELPLELQAKLLRVIQEREFERLGGKTIFKTDIRIIAATNRDLKIETEQKRFRSDLYYRLNVFPITLPPLRERKEDIPLLAMHFTKKISQKMRKHITAIQNESLQEMLFYNWPGNVRELEHVIEHSVISCKNSKLALSKPLLSKTQEVAKTIEEFKIKTLQETEREHIMNVLRYCRGRVRGTGGAAQLLNINPNTLESRMIKLGIKKQHVFS